MTHFKKVHAYTVANGWSCQRIIEEVRYAQNPTGCGGDFYWAAAYR
jgi:hypothetical protein